MPRSDVLWQSKLICLIAQTEGKPCLAWTHKTSMFRDGQLSMQHIVFFTHSHK